MIFEWPWIKGDITEAHGQIFINTKDDCVAVEYNTKLKIFINRKENTVEYEPCFYNTCLEIIK